MAQYTKYFDNCMAVFQGGGCKVIADIGAYEYAINHGVIINELAGTSAGSILAAMIAANQDSLPKIGFDADRYQD